MNKERLDELYRKNLITEKEYKHLLHGNLQKKSLGVRALWILSTLVTIVGVVSLVATQVENPFPLLGVLGILMFAGTYIEDIFKNQYIKNTIRLSGALLGSLLFGELMNWVLNPIFFFLYVLYFASAGYLTNSAFFIVLSSLCILPLIGMHQYSEPGSFLMIVNQPVFSTIVCSSIAFCSYQVSQLQVSEKVSRMLKIYARSMIICANISLYSGSIFGAEKSMSLSDVHLSIIWALILVASIIYGELRSIRWFVVTSVTFLILHVYTLYLKYIALVYNSYLGLHLIALGTLGLLLIKVLIELSKAERYK